MLERCGAADRQMMNHDQRCVTSLKCMYPNVVSSVMTIYLVIARVASSRKDSYLLVSIGWRDDGQQPAAPAMPPFSGKRN
jgi:hypothetical protein